MSEMRHMDAGEARALDAKDSKEVFGETMARLADAYPLLSVVVSDYGRRLSLDDLKARHPDAFVQCGIAEQNQIEVAAALANEEALSLLSPTCLSSRHACSTRSV